MMTDNRVILEEILKDMTTLAEKCQQNAVTTPLAAILYTTVGSVHSGGIFELLNIIKMFTRQELTRIDQELDNKYLN